MRKLTGKCKWILAVLLVTVSMAAGCNKVKDIDRIKAINERILELQELLEGRK